MLNETDKANYLEISFVNINIKLSAKTEDLF